jgi:hypothetical protein
MDITTERFYNIFSWWFIVWYFLYINKVITANPFIAATFVVIWDIFAAYYITSNNINKSISLNKQIVIYFRIFAVIMSHWVPLLTLPRFIDLQSISTFITLSILYLLLLYTQGFTPYSIYGSDLNNTKQINSLFHLFELRLGSVPMGILGFAFLFYTGYLLLNNPIKGSLLYKTIKF